MAFTLAVERAVVTGFEVHVDAAALADMERAEEAARAHVAAVRSAGASAGGTATMSGPHAARIQSAGGKTGAGGKALLGKKRGIYKKKHQTAAQAAHAEYVRKYRAAKRAALPVPP